MELLNEVFPIILYFLGAVLLVLLIIFVVKMINTVEKTNVLLDDFIAKSKSLDSLFDAIESVGDTISSVNMRIVNTFTNIISKLFRKKKNKKFKEENDEYE